MRQGWAELFASAGRDGAITPGITLVGWKIDGQGGNQKSWRWLDYGVWSKPDVTRQVFDALLTAKQELTIKYNSQTVVFGVAGAAKALPRLAKACGQ